MSQTENIANLEGLPKQFVSSLRILFDILDEKRSGFVRFQDIESRWNEEGVTGLPFGVVDALSKVTPANGCLTFERFVSGLKLALLTSTKQKSQSYKHEKENRSTVIRYVDRESREQEGGAPPPTPHQSIYAVPTKQHAPVTATVKPNNAINTNYRRVGSHQHINEINSNNNIISPPRPSRPPYRHQEKGDVPPQIPPRDRSQGNRVITELKSWHREQSRPTELDGSKWAVAVNNRQPRIHVATSNSHLLQPTKNYPSSESNTIYANIEQFQRKQNEEIKPQRVTIQRRNSGRRHTLTSGVDYNMVTS
ncbi:uncharacterized protein LOC126828383 [Patella vulgata]|uniref:uncharacterized protein LOC126828383 n=1 Tax=Patella vulgata TaxID=6465 RepID=UPI0024A8ACBB|nr:uncharacterized protein LOC126828383 [Patella vulgata]